MGRAPGASHVHRRRTRRQEEQVAPIRVSRVVAWMRMVWCWQQQIFDSAWRRAPRPRRADGSRPRRLHGGGRTPLRHFARHPSRDPEGWLAGGRARESPIAPSLPSRSLSFPSTRRVVASLASSPRPLASSPRCCASSAYPSRPLAIASSCDSAAPFSSSLCPLCISSALLAFGHFGPAVRRHQFVPSS